MRVSRWAVAGGVAAAVLAGGWWAKDAAAQVPDSVPLPRPKADPPRLPTLAEQAPPIPKQPPPAPVPPLPKSDYTPAVPHAPPTQFVNKPDLEFDYSVGKKGKSGVKGVTLFARDPAQVGKADMPKIPDPKGKNPVLLSGRWQAVHTAEAKDDTARLRYTLPSDGRFEFRLGVTGGNGNAAEVTDDQPADLAVVLDTTPPAVDDLEAKVDPAQPNVLRVSWRVSDANAVESADVFEYRPAAGGEWKPAKLTNGRFWTIPEDAPAEVAVRVQVADKVGNVTTRTLERVNLDVTVPEGKLTRVRAVEAMKKDEPKKDPVPLPPLPGSTPPLPHKLDKVK